MTGGMSTKRKMALYGKQNVDPVKIDEIQVTSCQVTISICGIIGFSGNNSFL